MKYYFQQSTIFEGSGDYPDPKKPVVCIKCRPNQTESDARKRLPQADLGRKWLRVDEKGLMKAQIDMEFVVSGLRHGKTYRRDFNDESGIGYEELKMSSGTVDQHVSGVNGFGGFGGTSSVSLNDLLDPESRFPQKGWYEHQAR